MALRKIALEGEECLTKVCRPVTDFNSRLHTLLDDMADTLAESGGCLSSFGDVRLQNPC